MKQPCGCCSGIQTATPAPEANRPGLSALSYRVGTYATFLESMIARLSTLYLNVPVSPGSATLQRIYPLKALTTREPSDPSITLLDAWATVADVLTFYQERIANEGYLETAIERRSILELARLVGYQLRPGVSAGVYLAFTVAKDFIGTIPRGTRAQSVPRAGQTPQFFETSEDLPARDVWNTVQPRLTQPQNITLSQDPDPTTDAATRATVYFKGISTNLNPGDHLLFAPNQDAGPQALRLIRYVETQPAQQRTLVTLVPAKPAGQIVSIPFPRPVVGLTGILGHLTVPLSVQPANLVQPGLTGILGRLTAPPSVQPANSVQLVRSVQTAFAPQSDIAPRLLTSFFPAAANTLYSALIHIGTPPKPVRVSAMRVKAGLFPGTYPGPATVISKPPSPTPAPPSTTSPPTPPSGPTIAARIGSSASPSSTGTGSDSSNADATTITTTYAPPTIITSWGALVDAQNPQPLSTIPLDNVYDKVVTGSCVAIERPTLDSNRRVTGSTITFHKVTAAQTVSMSTDGYSARVTQLTLDTPWLQDLPPNNPELPANNLHDALTSSLLLRGTVVYAQPEKLNLAEEPINDDIQGDTIELAQVYDGFDSGRWIIVSGERTDIFTGASTDISKDASQGTGVTASELVMISAVSIVPPVPISPGNQGLTLKFDQSIPSEGTTGNGGETLSDDPSQPIHTILTLAKGLAYKYRRDTVTICGNVVNATNGQTTGEVLGDGDSSQSGQQFALHQKPLTYLPAPTPAGAQSTLTVTVNEIKWNEADNLLALGPADRGFITQTDNNNQTTVSFGTGKHGVRVPTGTANVKAVYRMGTGQAGNVDAQQISQLATQPLGAKSVINPLPATGGADRDTIDQARSNTPIAVLALDRLVSVEDYADFARTYAGIGKAASARLSNGRQLIVHVTIAGKDDIPVDTNSALYHNLVLALQQSGDPYQPLQVAMRTLKLMIISAAVKLQSAYQWESVEPTLRSTLLDFFSFERRNLGQNAYLSEAIGVMQGISGVKYVDVTKFDSVAERNTDQLDSLASNLTRRNAIRAELARVDLNGGDSGIKILPAELAILTPDIPDTLILTEITT